MQLVAINNKQVKFDIVDNKIFTTSKSIADVFEKNHQHILEKIKGLLQDEFSWSNFRHISIDDNYGRKQPAYELTRDGFSLLVMGFTGAKAYDFKVKFIEAFNQLERQFTIGKEQFTLAIQELQKKSIESDTFKNKYYEMMEMTNKLLVQKIESMEQSAPAPSYYLQGKALTHEEKMEIERLYKLNNPIVKIAKKLGRGTGTISKYLRQGGLR